MGENALGAIRRALDALRGRRREAPPRAAWLSDRLLMLVAPVNRHAEPAVRAAARLGGRPLDLEAAGMSFRGPGAEGRGGGTLVVARLPEDGRRRDIDRMRLRVGRRRLRLGAAELSRAATGPESLVAGPLAGLDPATGERLLRFVLERCAGDVDGPDSFQVATGLRTLRQSLRERLPLRTINGEEALSVHVDEILAIGERAFWIKGWVRDHKHAAESLTVTSPEGFRADVLADSFRHPRRDVEQLYGVSGMEAAERHGLISFFELPGPSRLTAGWTAELRTATGGGVELEVPAIVRDFATVRETILHETKHDTPASYEVTERHAHPALARLQKRLRESLRVESVIQHGSPPASPAVSVIVPLYGRIDFVHHQIVQFVRDPDLAGADILYVLDSPELAEALHKETAELHEFYGLPFRVAILNRNGGFANANNVAAELARGRQLVLLNSDVFPDRPGWLSTMSSFYDATPTVGALGPKLLYEDGSLQHAGMFFLREAESRLWGNQHYYKGLHRHFPAAEVARPVAAVTGACLMIDRALYEQVGGLSDDYVQGGYEDSDLALRLIEAGRSNWYLPAAELYHLEDQSYPTDSDHRKLVTRYNTWLQSHRWGERIEELVRAEGASEAGGRAVTLAS